MFAVIESGGRQYRISKGDIIRVEKLKGNIGEEVILDNVLMVGNGEDIFIGNPRVDNARIVSKIIRHGQGKKIIIFKHKRRKNYRKKQGHRQPFSEVKITEIEGSVIGKDSANVELAPLP
ncbi:MAG: 50S ribosomal protein L21 [Nitrospinae bacterium]|nr:50S ribosomal protein L21 [Nitrospinota bacterium]